MTSIPDTLQLCQKHTVPDFLSKPDVTRVLFQSQQLRGGGPPKLVEPPT